MAKDIITKFKITGIIDTTKNLLNVFKMPDINETKEINIR